MLGEFGGGDDDFCVGDAVVGEEEALEVVFGFAVVVDDVADLVDELDDALGVVVGGGGLSGEHDGSGDDLLPLFGGEFLDPEVPPDDVEDVHELPLVLVDSLDLDVEHAVGVDVYSAVLLDPLGQSLLVVQLDGPPSGAEVFVFGFVLQFSESAHVQDPFVGAEAFRVEVGLFLVGADDPSSDGHSVGHVDEFVGEDVHEILEEGGLHQFRVDGGHSVHGVGSDDAEVGHSDLLGGAFLDQGEAVHLFEVVGVFFADLVEPEVVDEVDELEVSGEEPAQKVD